MWRQPEGMRKLPWSRRFRLLLGGEPWTKDEAAALAEYVDWLSGPTLLLSPAMIGVGVLLGVLVVDREPVAAVGTGAAAFVAALGVTLLVRQQALKRTSERPGALSVQQAVTAGLTILVVIFLVLGTRWMTHQVTVLVAGEDLLRVVSEVDEQWWGRVNTIVVSDTQQVPTALERETPDILLLTGASDPVAEGVGAGFVVGHREGDPATVVTLHLTNDDGPTVDLMQELLTWPGPGPEAFRRAGFVFGEINSP